MATSAQVNVFTGAMRSEFIDAYEAAAAPAPWEEITLSIDSTSREEIYPWLSPTPGIDEYLGHRRVGKISEILYTVPNKEYDAAFEVRMRDVKDEKTGGYLNKAKELGQKAKLYPGREVLTHLAAGKTRKCFDGTAFFADSHTIGTGDNLMAANPAANDAVVHNIIALVRTNAVKPLIWQNRMDVELQDDLDTAAAKFAKKGRFWVDLEGAAAFGRWHDAILMEISDTPTLTELQTYLGDIETRFRTFKLHKNLPADKDEFVHEQIEFNTSTITFVVSSNLGNMMRQIMESETIVNSGAAVTNIYKGFGKVIVSSIVNTIT